MHNGIFNLGDEKMSKSLGNILTLREILDKYRPEALILVFLGSHYRSPMELTAEVLEEAEQQVNRLRNVFTALSDRAAAVAGEEENEAAVSAEPAAIAEPPLAGGPAAEPPAATEPAAAELCAAGLAATGPGEAVGPGAAFLTRVAAGNRPRRRHGRRSPTPLPPWLKCLGWPEANAALAAGGLSAAAAARVRAEMGRWCMSSGSMPSPGALPLSRLISSLWPKSGSRAAPPAISPGRMSCARPLLSGVTK